MAASIFDASDSSKISSDWQSFLIQPDVSCPVTIETTSSGSGAAGTKTTTLVCKENPRFWGLTFKSSANNERFGPTVTDFNVGNGVAIGLPRTDTARPPVPPVNVVLTAFGFVKDAQGQFAKGTLVDTIITKVTGQLLALTIDTTEPRCALWLTPGVTFRVDTALAFQIDSSKTDAVRAITDSIASKLSLNRQNVDIFSNIKIFLQRTCYGAQSFTSDTDFNWHVTTTCRLTFRFTWGNFWFWITYEPTGLSFSVTQNMDKSIGNPSLWNSLDQLGVAAISSSAVTPVLEGLTSPVRLVCFTAGETDSGGIYWRVFLSITLGRPKTPTTGPVEIFLLYDSASKTFSGGLITEGFYATGGAKFLPSYEPGTDIDAPEGTNPPQAWDLKQLSTDFDGLPQGLPTAIAEAVFSYQFSDTSGGNGSLHLSAKLIRPPPPPNKLVPSPAFTMDELDLQFVKSTGIACSLSAFFTLKPRDGDPWPAAHLGLSISYDSITSTNSTWTLTGYADDLSLGLLYDFFDPEYVDPLVSALGSLKIVSLDLLYTYASGVASSFCFKGLISLGPVQLRLVYQYASKEAGDATAAKKMNLPSDGPQAQAPVTKTATWRFECDLETTGDDATIGDIISAISAEDGKLLPDFISKISLTKTDGAGNRRLISIEVAKTTDSQIFFALQVAIASVTFTYLQLAPKDKTKKTKRFIRFAADKIPLLKDIPLLGELPQPFDGLEYFWVNSVDGGFRQSEVDTINKEPQMQGDAKLLYKMTQGPVRDKDTGKPDEGSQSDPVVIQSGHHFVVLKDNEVVLDHVCSPTPTAAAVTTSPPPDSSPPAAASPPADSSPPANQIQAAPKEPAKPSKGALSFSIGPLSISAVTLQYKEKDAEKVLSVTMDATFTLGPISLTLLGFSIGVPLSGDIRLNNLAGIISQIAVDLQGMAVSFDKPPLLLAGSFQHPKTTSEEMFLGSLGISFPPYTFIGLGQYKVLNDYKSVFIYAKLDGPIITLEFATVEGVRLGFGYNSMVRSPTIDELTSFPFIDDASNDGAGSNPINILQSMVAKPPDNPWVIAKKDSYWFAAGMTVTAFDVLKITAVAMFAFRDSGLIISLFADAVAQMPPGVTNQAEMIIYVEIGMVAEMNFVDGYFRVEAALAPTSFLLCPACHVYGGFALVYWFAPNDHAGDWVFSVGGYHKNYDKPDWYPEPKRIGIAFSLGILNIVGESYFAITPKVAMGGALIHVSLGFGPIEAWLDAAMDALVNFHPLHYIVDFSVSVGVSFNIDVWFIHIHIHASVGAWLHIEGPEFGGTAYVDFYLFGFSVDFGASPQAPPAATLLEFWEMLHKPGPGSDSTPDADKTVQSSVTYKKIGSDGVELKVDSDNQPLPKVEIADGAALKFILEDGNYPMPAKLDPTVSPKTKPPNTGTGAKWFVRGGSFAFRIASDFAIGAAHINGDPNDPDPTEKPIDVSASTVTTQPICSFPMRLAVPIDSTLTITIRQRDAPQKIIAGWTSVALAIKLVPAAVWAPYDQALDPIFTRDPRSLLKKDPKVPYVPTVPLALALKVCAPDPELAVSFIPIFKPSMVANFRVLDFRTNKTNGTDWILAATEKTQTTYLAAPLSAAETALVKAKNLDKLWENTQAAWTGLDVADVQTTVDGAGGVIEQVAGFFGWAKSRPQGEAVLSPPPWKLTGKVPEKLVANMKNCYLELPRMAVLA